MKVRLRNQLRGLLYSVALLSTLAITQNVHAATCGFTSIGSLSFGAYDVFGPNVDTASSISFLCTGVMPGNTVVIDFSIGSAPSFTPRQMVSGAFRLNYNIYLDASRIAIWGDGTGGSSRYGPVTPPEATTVNVSVFGRIPSGQDAHVGTYTDNVVITMHY